MRVIRQITMWLALALLSFPLSADPSAQELLAAGRVDEAIARVQSDKAKDAASYNLLCRAYFSLSEWDRSVGAGEQAVGLDPSNSRYHLWLGRAYGEKAAHSKFLAAAGLAKKVRAEFETSVRLSPDSVDARTDLAEFYLEAPAIVGGGRDKAEAEARSLEELDPAKALWVQARIAQKHQDLATAEKDYRAAIAASHGSANAWLNLALFYHHAGRLDEMQDAINHAAAAAMNQPAVLMEGAEVLIRAGRDFPAAVRMLRRYLSNSTVEEAPAFKAHYLLGTVLEKQGDTQGAANEYRASLALASGFSRAQEALDRLNR